MKRLFVLAIICILAGCSSGSDNDGTAGGTGELLTDPQVQQKVDQHLAQNPDIQLTPEAKAELEKSLAGLEQITQEDLDKILKEIDRTIRFYQEDPKEIFDKKVKRVLVHNYYFEDIPYDYVSKLICEEGIFEMHEFIKWYLKD